MKVRCINIDPEQFPVAQEHREFFKTWFGRGKKNKVFDEVEVGRTYVVYAVEFYSGFPFYYVTRTCRLAYDWGLIPSLCFEVIDDRPSALWRFRSSVAKHTFRRGAMINTLAIKEWFEPGFINGLVELQERERKIMFDAAAAMDAEFGPPP